MDLTQYFYRCAVFSRKDNVTALADVYEPNNRTELDEWLGSVLSLADGKHTVQELFDYMASRYDTPPENLTETLHSVFERLIDGKMIQLHASAIDLPYYLAAPIEELDLEKAKLAIEKDGYVFH